jgi:diguanylate cyclase (GGDEF)-like protein
MTDTPGTAVADDAQLKAAIAGFARTWGRDLAHANFVPGGRARARTVLERLTAQLRDALNARSFDPKVGYHVGRELVLNDMSSPRAMGVTVRLLSGRLLHELRISGPSAAARLADLLEELTVGFTETLRDRVLVAAEGINRAERVAWRSRQRELQNEVQHALLHDPLTGLPNRAALTRQLRALLTDPRPVERLGVCLLNLQRFAAVNDSLGTDRGDQLLLDVAQRLDCVANHRGYFVAHLGGDTFALVIEGTTGPDDAVKAADEALRALPDPWRIDNHDIPMFAKAGVVERLIAGADPAELVQAASTALGWARQDRTRLWMLFEPDRNAAQVRRHQITNAMPAALQHDAFTLAYQPLVRLDDGVVIGMEALARWQHPALGTIRPTEFIRLAEELGLIGPLGEHLLRTACTHAAAWQHAAHPPLISVNLAVPQLQQPDLVATVTRILHETGLPPAQLQLEITEEALIDPADGSAETLDALARHGIKLAIDDFGTGYANLANVVDLPVHTVKLDARFLDGIDEHVPVPRSNTTMLAGLIELIHRLELTATAEGVRTPQQVAILRGYGCDVGQGFHLGQPMTVDHATALFDRAAKVPTC